MENRRIDRRVQRTRELLQDALTKLILEKEYDKITVQNIIDEANVGRSTFYAHYLDKDDLMAGSVEGLRRELHQHIADAGDNDEEKAAIASLALFRHTQEQHHLYKAMIGGRGIEIVTEVLNDALVAHAQAYFERIEEEQGALTFPIPVLTTYLAGTLQTLLTWWLDSDMPYSAEEMNEMFHQLAMGGITAATSPE
jgi:AcrR family transcriptional regulator